MLLSSLIISTTLAVALMVVAFIVAQYTKNTTVVDIAWGVGFLLLALFTFFAQGLYLSRHILATMLVSVWALRLTTHLYIRVKGKKEDPRYTKFRHEWGNSFAIRSFFQIFILQAFLLILIVYPIILVNSSIQPGLTIIDYLGLMLWIIGFAFEVIGDQQLKHFVSNPANKGQVMDKGLWRYTRHPNYFGEITMWWALFMIACCIPYGITAIISPIAITTLLLFVSGIPMTEKLLDNSSSYQEYKKRTSALFPWFPKKKSFRS